jgi:DNA-binding CsgD family transcriptional regulator
MIVAPCSASSRGWHGYLSGVDGSVLRVGVVSSYALVRAGMTRLVDGHAGRAAVVQAAGHDGQLAGLDVVIYDLGGLRGDAQHPDLLQLLGTVPVVGLARGPRDALGVGARTLGVDHIVDEAVSASDLLDVLEAAAVVPPARARRSAPHVLTDRERQVLGLIAAGLTNVEIAQLLFLSINSVKIYIRSAYRKIGVTTRPQAVLWAVANQLTRTPDRG